ncbi:MAG: class I SAM-dependent methyltransferase [Nitrospirae bacterium]|nr:class I SAM-dependent methyltransferase [Nitrospirota bacterium]MBI3594561.1 class I SAM-dependent methyltransferase [Nitrospirota bacterium]
MEEASLFLKKILLYQQKGKALDVAMGRGRNSLFLARNGYQVDGIELSREAISDSKAVFARNHISVNIIEADLEKIALAQDSYDLVICFFYLQRNLLPQIRSAVKKEGFVVYETFLIDQHLKHGSPGRKEFCFEHNELLHFFEDFRIHYYEEGVGENNKITARIIAQKK